MSAKSKAGRGVKYCTSSARRVPLCARASSPNEKPRRSPGGASFCQVKNAFLLRRIFRLAANEVTVALGLAGNEIAVAFWLAGDAVGAAFGLLRKEVAGALRPGVLRSACCLGESRCSRQEPGGEKCKLTRFHLEVSIYDRGNTADMIL